MGCRQIGDPCRPPTMKLGRWLPSRCRLSCVFGLVRCAWAAAGICHSQVRHFEGNFNLAGMAFFFACGGLGVVETTTVDVVRVCVMRVRVRQFLRVCTKPLLYTTAADRKLSCACKARDRLFSRCLSCRLLLLGTLAACT